jgi:coenzyme F420 hydrogenase subunit delta
MTDICRKDILVLGCGNVLFGDDGFGPSVARYFQQNFEIPSNVCVIDAGLTVRKILFDIILSDERPRKIIIVDAVDIGRAPGEVFDLDIEEDRRFFHASATHLQPAERIEKYLWC